MKNSFINISEVNRQYLHSLGTRSEDDFEKVSSTNIYAVQGSIARMLWCLVRHSFCLEARRCLLSKLSDVLLTKYPLCVVSQPSVLVSHWWTWRLCPVLAALTDCPYLATAHCSSHQTLPSPPLYTILPLLLGTLVTFAIQLELYVYMYTCSQICKKY